MAPVPCNPNQKAFVVLLPPHLEIKARSLLKLLKFTQSEILKFLLEGSNGVVSVVDTFILLLLPLNKPAKPYLP